MDTLKKHDIETIDMVVVNLYPFEKIRGACRGKHLKAGCGTEIKSLFFKMFIKDILFCHTRGENLWLKKKRIGASTR
jgi:hypothetical protein